MSLSLIATHRFVKKFVTETTTTHTNNQNANDAGGERRWKNHNYNNNNSSSDDELNNINIYYRYFAFLSSPPFNFHLVCFFWFSPLFSLSFSIRFYACNRTILLRLRYNTVINALSATTSNRQNEQCRAFFHECLAPIDLNNAKHLPGLKKGFQELRINCRNVKLIEASNGIGSKKALTERHAKRNGKSNQM